jgi:hypothetical protein
MSTETLSSENKEAAAIIPGGRAGSVRTAAALAAAKVIGVRHDLLVSDAEELLPPLRVTGQYTVESATPCAVFQLLRRSVPGLHRSNQHRPWRDNQNIYSSFGRT